MAAIDTDARSIERLLPLLHAQLCSPPADDAPTSDASSSWLTHSLDRWQRCFHVWRKLIGADVVFLVLLFHTGCVWSPDYAALEAVVTAEDAPAELNHGNGDGDVDVDAGDVLAGLVQQEPSVWALEVLHFIRLFELYESKTVAAAAEDETALGECDPDGEVTHEDEEAEAPLSPSSESSHRRFDAASGATNNKGATAVPPHRCPPPLGHSTVLIEALAARVVAASAEHGHGVSPSRKSRPGARGPTTAVKEQGQSERHQEVLQQLLVSLADRDETVVQRVATNLVDRWLALTGPADGTDDDDDVTRRARRDYCMASAIKFAAHVDAVSSALYEENTHIAAVLMRQKVLSAPLQHVLQTAVPSILCCLLLEEHMASGGSRASARDADVTLTCLVPQPLLLPYYLVGRGSSVAVWVPTHAGPRGGIRAAVAENMPHASSVAGDDVTAHRGQFVVGEVCSDGVWSGCGGSGAVASAMTLTLCFRPEMWWAVQGGSREQLRASLTSVFPSQACSAPSPPAVSPGAGHDTFSVRWTCDGTSAAHSYLRTDALVPRALFAASLPLASASPSSSSSLSSAASAAVSYQSIIDKLIARETGPRAMTRASTLFVRPVKETPFASSRKRSRGGASARGHPTTTHASFSLAHPLLSVEVESATLISFSGSNGLSAAHTVPYWAARAHETSETTPSPKSHTAEATRRRGRRPGPHRAATAASSGQDGQDYTHATRTLTQLLQTRFHYAHVHMSATRTSSTALRAGISRDPIAVVAQSLHLTGRRVLALRSLVEDAWRKAEVANLTRHRGDHVDPQWAQRSSPQLPTPAISTGLGKAGHRHASYAPSERLGAEMTTGEPHSAAPLGGNDGDDRAVCVDADASTAVVVSLASSLSLAALVVAHSVVEKVLLSQTAATLWSTEVSSALVDYALLLHTRPHAPLLRAAGIGVCVLPQRPQSLLVMVGLVASVAVRQQRALLQGASSSPTTRSGSRHGGVPTPVMGTSSWWSALDTTVLQDRTLPGLFHPGTWRLLESATHALHEAAQTQRKREARRVARLGVAPAQASTPEDEARPSATSRSEEDDPTPPSAASLASVLPVRDHVKEARAAYESVSQTHGGLLELEARWMAIVRGVDGDDADSRWTSTSHALWCSPDAALPGDTAQARLLPSPARAPPITALIVDVEDARQAWARRTRSTVATSTHAAPGAVCVPWPTPSTRGPGRRLQLGRAAPVELSGSRRRTLHLRGQTAADDAVEVDPDVPQPLLLQQMHWLWLLTENASTQSRETVREH